MQHRAAGLIDPVQHHLLIVHPTVAARAFFRNRSVPYARTAGGPPWPVPFGEDAKRPGDQIPAAFDPKTLRARRGVTTSVFETIWCLELLRRNLRFDERLEEHIVRLFVVLDGISSSRAMGPTTMARQLATMPRGRPRRPARRRANNAPHPGRAGARRQRLGVLRAWCSGESICMPSSGARGPSWARPWNRFTSPKSHTQTGWPDVPHLLGRAALLDLALVDDHHAVGHFQRFFLVVGHEDAGHMQLRRAGGAASGAVPAPWRRARRRARRAAAPWAPPPGRGQGDALALAADSCEG